MVGALILICLIFFLLILESRINHSSINRISIRVHVNGTRGKSSVTAYISAALRDNGKKVVGKVTGEIPALILPDGTRKSIRRIGPARIREQFRTIHRAARAGADALVLECMSIDPSLQATESKFFKPHISVLSNIRDDHREKLGRTSGEQVTAMCSAIPAGGVLVTNDLENLEAIRTEASKKKCRLVVAGALNKDILVQELPGGLPVGVFPENIALAVEVAVQAGIPGDEATRAILGEICRQRNGSGNKTMNGEITFLNAFSVNDPDSTTAFLNRWGNIHGIGNNPVLIFNTRSDRPLRTEMFLGWIRDRRETIRGIFITGNHRAWAYAHLKNLKPAVEVCKIGANQVPGLRQRLLRLYGAPVLVLGIGNIMGAGYRILNEFENDH